MDILRKGICSYYNFESIARKCICSKFPILGDEPEYRAALEMKGCIEIFGFLCEWEMMPTPLWLRYKIRKPSQLRRKVEPIIKKVDELGDLIAYPINF